MTSFLAPTQRYATGALFALALHQAQIHQTRPLGFSDDDARAEERTSSCSGSSSDSVSEDPELWVHESSALLRPVFRFLLAFFIHFVLEFSNYHTLFTFTIGFAVVRGYMIMS